MYIEKRGFVPTSSLEELKDFLDNKNILFNTIEDSIYVDVDTKILNDLYKIFLDEEQFNESFNCDTLEFYED